MLSRSLSSPLRAIVVVVLAILLALPGLVAPPPALATAAATTTTIETAAVVVPPTFNATVSVRPNPFVQGQIGTCVAVDLDGVNPLCVPLDANGDLVATFTDVALGAHVIHAVFAGGGDWLGSSATLDVTVGRPTTVELQAGPLPATSSDLVTVRAQVVLASGDLSGGFLSIEDSTTGTLIAVSKVGPTKDTVSVTTRFSAGDHPLTAMYSGSADIAGSAKSMTLSITPDATVDWMGLAKVPAVFYPVVDGYRDTLRVAGILNERASVIVRVKDANGHLVRRKDLGTHGAGTVAWAWDGRTAAGTLLPAGKYTVTMGVTDMSGNTDSEGVTISLSRKQLSWSTVTITKHGDDYGYTWDPGDGTISQARSAYANGVRLSAGDAFTGVRYAFDLHAATVYGSFTVRVLGRSPSGLTSVAGLWRGRMDDPVVSADRTMPYDRSTIGPGYGWWSVRKTSTHRDGLRVYAQVLVEDPFLVGGPLNSFDIRSVQLVYRYAVLR